MHTQFNENLTLVRSAEEFEAFLDEVVPVTSSIMTDLHRTARPHLPRPTTYPVLITTSSSTGMLFTPVDTVLKAL